MAYNEVQVGEWFGIESFSSLQCRVKGVQVAMPSVHFFYQYIGLTKGSTSRGFREAWGR